MLAVMLAANSLFGDFKPLNCELKMVWWIQHCIEKENNLKHFHILYMTSDVSILVFFINNV